MDIDIGEHSCLRGRKKKGPVCKDGAFLFYRRILFFMYLWGSHFLFNFN